MDSSSSFDLASATGPESEEQTPSVALQEPVQPTSLGFQILYGLANTVIGLGNITFFTLLLPASIAQVAPHNQTNTFIIISALGAGAAILTNPLVGALSDRTTSPLGRRLPWLLIGLLVLGGAMLLLAYASSVLIVGLGTVLLQIAINILLAALSAIIPDQVPLRQRATVSAVGGMAPLVGGLLGQILVGQVIKNVASSFLDLALLSVGLVLLFSLVLRDERLPKQNVPPFHLRDVPRSLWLNPRQHPDFALTWAARCLVFLASTTVINYLFYYLTTEQLFAGAQVATGVQIFYAVYVLVLLVSSLVCGKLSDHVQRRKPFVIGASLTMAVGVFLLAFVPVWHVVLVADVVLGLGFGCYLGVDLALASQLLPTARNRGKDFGLINTAIFLPMLLAPAIAGLALSLFHSYAALFSVIAVGTILAAALILPIQSVR
jgi:MFS family permease